MTIVRELMRRWSEPTIVLCDARLQLREMTVKCDKSAGHLPVDQHSSTVRWSAKP